MAVRSNERGVMQMYRQMRYFIAVVETNSFFEAGEVCHISQSAISQQIKALEGELQVRLLERHGRKFTVTPASRYFYEQAKKQVQTLDSTVREVRRIASGEYQRLRIGVLNGFSARIIQKTVRDFTSSHPHVRLSLTTGTHEELLKKEGKYLHIYLDFIRSLLWSFCLQKLSGVCVCVYVYSYYLNGKVLLSSKI